MTPTVHILFTLRKPELAAYSNLVFDTIRVGFPTARIVVHINNVVPLPFPHEKLRGLGCEIRYITDGTSKLTCDDRIESTPATIHHEWIQNLLSISLDPYWVCDCDQVFYESVEDWTFTEPLAGRLIPEWKDEFTNCITRPRLHTSLLYMDPNGIRDRLAKYRSQFPETPFNPFANLIYPLCTPLNGQTYFHDTCCLLYHAIGGQAFTEQQLEAYSHLNFGTIPDIVLPRLKDGEQMQKLREEIIADPARAKGLWRIQEAYYSAHSSKARPVEIRKTDKDKCHEFAEQVCCGDQDALQFCSIAMQYFHRLDDVIDCPEALTSEETVGAFVLALQFYNCPFYLKHRVALMPIVYSITNTYADTVLFERSPENHKRAIADVLKCCGNELFHIVSLLTGGYDHMRKLSPLIRERSWIIQHTEENA